MDWRMTLRTNISENNWVSHGLDAREVAVYNTSLGAVNGIVDYDEDAVEDCDDTINNGTVRRNHNLRIMRQLCVEPALFHKHGRAEFDDTARRITVASPGPKLRAALELVRHLVFEGHDKIVIVSEFVVRI